MTDEQYIFIAESREKKALARNTFAKRSGAKSKKCSLPSDHLTAKQLRERSGPVMTVNLNKPMDWNTFKRISDASKREYLDHLRDLYSVNAAAIADMLGVSYSSLRVVCGGMLPRYVFPKGGRNKPDTEGWNRFLGLQDAPGSFEAPHPSTPTPDPVPAGTGAPASLCGGSLRFTGTPGEVFRQMYALLDPAARYSITVAFEREEKADLSA